MASIMSPLPARHTSEPALFPDSLIVGSRAIDWGCFRVFALLPQGSRALGLNANLAVLGNIHEPELWTLSGSVQWLLWHKHYQGRPNGLTQRQRRNEWFLRMHLLDQYFLSTDIASGQLLECSDLVLTSATGGSK